MFAAHHNLSNLIAIVDNNGQQAFGKTKDIIDLNPLGEKWQAFGWEVHEVDGHDTVEIVKTLRALNRSSGSAESHNRPHDLRQRVSFMEGKVEWHYLPLSDEQYVQAVREIQEAGEP